MLTLLQILLLLAVIATAGFVRLALPVAAAAFAVMLMILTQYGSLSGILLVPIWLIFIAVTGFFLLAPLRRRYLSHPIYHMFRRMLPPISETEREALDAGDIWWEAELFSGRPDWQRLHNFPKPALNLTEQAFLDNQVEVLCAMLDDWQITHKDHDLPAEVWAYLKQEKFFGMVIPQQYGGLGFSAIAHSTIVLKLSTRSISTAVNVMVPNSLGPAELLLHYGTDKQKNYYLPRLAAGDEIPCFALTGPDAGSDAAAMTDTGVICKAMHEGKETLGIRLNWDKHYITLAPVATVLGLAVKLYDPDHLLGAEESLGITCCLIPTNTPGVDIGKRHFPLNLAFMNGPTRGKHVFIPLSSVIGGPDMVGKGWSMLMDCLSVGRSISLPALGTATCKFSALMTGAYARVRHQFKTPIGYFEGVEEGLAVIAGYAYMVEAARVLTAGAVDQGVKPSLASAIAKYHMTECGRHAINAAMDIHAGRGVQLGPKNYLGRIYQATPISITVEGANILTRNLMIYGQGAVRCHPFVRAEMEAAHVEVEHEGLQQFDKILYSHVGFMLSNIIRTLIFSFGGERLVQAPVTGPTAKYYRSLTRMSSALAFVSDIAMLILGGDLKRKERISARLGDVLSYLYLGSSVLKYYHDNGAKPEELCFVEWSLTTCLYKIQVAFDGFFANFTNRPLAYLLRFVVFPFGRHYTPPLDKTDRQIARVLLSPSASRDRLTQYCYKGEGSDDLVAAVLIAFEKMSAASDIYKAVYKAVREGIIARYSVFSQQAEAACAKGVISQDELEIILASEAACKHVIRVDEFDPDSL